MALNYRVLMKRTAHFSEMEAVFLKCHIRSDLDYITVDTKHIQSVPLPIKPGSSLIIPKPMKILQRDLNRSTFVAWEMNRNMSVVKCLYVSVVKLLKNCQVW